MEELRGAMSEEARGLVDVVVLHFLLCEFNPSVSFGDKIFHVGIVQNFSAASHKWRESHQCSAACQEEARSSQDDAFIDCLRTQSHFLL